MGRGRISGVNCTDQLWKDLHWVESCPVYLLSVLFCALSFLFSFCSIRWALTLKTLPSELLCTDILAACRLWQSCLMWLCLILYRLLPSCTPEPEAGTRGKWHFVLKGPRRNLYSTSIYICYHFTLPWAISHFVKNWKVLKFSHLVGSRDIIESNKKRMRKVWSKLYWEQFILGCIFGLLSLFLHKAMGH